MPPQLELKQVWKKLFISPVLLVSTLVIALAIPRFYWMINGQYNHVIIVFLIMWILPFVFLTKIGRQSMGIRIPNKPEWLIYGFIFGLVAALLIHYIGKGLYGQSVGNWYISIMNSFNKNNLIEDIKPNPLLFILITFPTMIFSPIGEEFFFRGMVQDSFSTTLGNGRATLIDAGFFGITHLAHHGAALILTSYEFFLSALIWIALMGLVSLLLTSIRTKSGSIWGAVVCHAGFNFGMMGSIVYLLHE